MWTLNDGIAVCQTLDPLLRSHNAFIALTGEVLHDGSSKKDLDLVIIPLKNNLTIKQHVAICKILAERYKFTRVVDNEKYGDDKYVEMYETVDKKRIDIIYMKLEQKWIS